MAATQNEKKQARDNGRRPLLIISGFAAFITIATIALFSNIITKRTADTTLSLRPLPVTGGPVIAGDTAIDFTLTNLEGTAVTLSEHLGHPIMINFWATWCAPCRIEMPELQALHDLYAADGLVILAINQAETAEVADEFFFDEMGLTFTSPLLDTDSTVANEYGVRSLPTTLFIDENGQVTAVHRGPATLSQFEEYLVATTPVLFQ